jgi:tetratricopeptide (TPR) repeat protein
MSVDQEKPNPKPLADDDLPEWLREIRRAAPKPKPEPPSPAARTPQVEPASADDDLPAWLKEVEAEGELAIEMTPQESPPAARTEASDQADDLWQQILAEEGVDLEELPEERPEGAENMSFRDWLAANSTESPLARSEPSPFPSATPQPTKEREPEAEPVQLEDDGIVVEDELPDWLRADQPLEAEASSLAWLTDETSYRETVEETTAAEVAPSVEGLADDGIVVEDELPDWLRSDRPVEVETTSLSWLSDEATYTETAAEPTEAVTEVAASMVDLEDEGIVVTDELPDWLREDQPAQAGAETPAWLSDEASYADLELEEASLPAAAATEVDLDDGLGVADELPDWLRDDRVLEPGTGPLSWLRDESTYEASLAEAEMETEELPASLAEGDLFEGEELPDWLQEEEADETILDFEPAEIEPIQPTAEVKETTLAEDDLIDVTGLPDWLRDEQALTAEVEAETDREVSPWLTDAVEEGAAVSVEDLIMAEAEALDWLPELETEEMLLDTLQVDKAPAWLDTSTIEEDILTDVEEFEVSPAAAEDARLPTWLEKLKTGQEKDREQVTEEQPAEEVLSAAPVAETFVAAQPKLKMAPPDKGLPPIKEKESAAAKLSVAAATLNSGDLEEALTIYQDLINTSQFLDKIIDALATSLDRYQDAPAIYEVLGDAQVRNGQLNSALQSYQLALEKL